MMRGTMSLKKERNHLEDISLDGGG